MMIHGSETEQVLRSSLLRIKVEQAEALEAQKRKAAEEGEEVEDEEENMLEESKDEISNY